MGKLTDLPNIGTELESILIRSGIQTAGQLKLEGSENAFLKISAADPKACINTLYALEGAIQGIRWHELDSLKKAELREFYRMIRKQQEG